ncbi:conserved hypothetical protein [Rhodospirillaceae bacterium LM-1]|nr:conserved hypothetical protein [Rhodospirillaceae bacterium LM-1]
MDPIAAADAPYAVELEAGTVYVWCACGRSKAQPYCDGSHVGTGLAPKVFKAEKSGTAYLCACKRTKTKPYCDGSHKTT